MTKTEVQEALQKLPVEEQLELAGEVYNTAVPLYDWQQKAIDEALIEHERNPEGARSWSEVRKELWPDQPI